MSSQKLEPSSSQHHSLSGHYSESPLHIWIKLELNLKRSGSDGVSPSSSTTEYVISVEVIKPNLKTLDKESGILFLKMKKMIALGFGVSQ
ncbi:unnamed protein product [Camellia sinensis]